MCVCRVGFSVSIFATNHRRIQIVTNDSSNKYLLSIPLHIITPTLIILCHICIVTRINATGHIESPSDGIKSPTEVLPKAQWVLPISFRIFPHSSLTTFQHNIYGTYPVLCAYSIFCRKIRFFAFSGDIFLIFGKYYRVFHEFIVHFLFFVKIRPCSLQNSFS